MNPVYTELYTILKDFIFGTTELTPYMEYVLTLLTTIGVVGTMAVPFVLVGTVIRCFLGVME